MRIHSYLKRSAACSLAILLGVMLLAFQPAKVSAASLYSLQSRANSNYVSADNYGNDPLVANRTSASSWEQFQIINNSDGTISLLSMANNKYVAADLNQGAKLIARSTSVQQWEKFRRVNLDDGSIALQAMANNQYVSTDLNNGAVLVANRAAVGGAWEAFSLVTSGSSNVSKPGEAPSYIWNYAVNADNHFGKNGDFALLICAVIKQETSYGANLGGVSGGDGLMQVEPNTRNAYSGEFSSTFGHAYNHNDQQDQVYMGAMILNDMINLANGDVWRGLVNYNGGPGWYPGATDSYGRPILADQYANTVYGTYKSYGGLY
ncbi:transglycosylase SLT domain-containing protein [Paenibacillus physcomitrellae]|uniref:Transglycosylase SLT domain-containing protein n=1 Tax=Paenibacillus physcomitrellae TaxID=1619311 RepID=A0ABQ1G0E3_9BACL|nr:transglycosylase SLT domain-containing protein [Paenibacillus physcomitrellae]GGA34178.1 hypothetical protein GCM10010917_19290 [Paenibacillus physcomitrellae]